MDCGALAWYEQQDEALQTRIRMLACFTADLQGLDWRRILPGASKGARDDPDMFDRIVDHILAPLLSERMQQAVRRSLEDEGPAVPTAPAQDLDQHIRHAYKRRDVQRAAVATDRPWLKHLKN